MSRGSVSSNRRSLACFRIAVASGQPSTPRPKKTNSFNADAAVISAKLWYRTRASQFCWELGIWVSS